MAYEVKDGDVAIVISPVLDDEGAWTGVLKTGLVFGESQHPIAMRSAMDYGLTMAAASEVLEDYPELVEYFDDARHRILKELFPTQYAESELAIAKEKEYTTEGNVIKLTKWTKTLGEA
mgnify:FL=1|tara:strand:+ start:526 stop:882 length:357 start_codon:yes stop_codon:yes gene_type:complete